ncbi:Metal-response element-binding transcription factor 2 [Holothuria leucospilota]|uniref:Metal-response element-binding transcription factor 2 n=1 Tax=Holothuria leucospilota TaxID=206669 RepID=A0A9Q1C6Q6_HOLLE|nr:Metal-response element-binding transcription factor 2 [Holothuria leucospilota]
MDGEKNPEPPCLEKEPGPSAIKIETFQSKYEIPPLPPPLTFEGDTPCNAVKRKFDEESPQRGRKRTLKDSPKSPKLNSTAESPLRGRKKLDTHAQPDDHMRIDNNNISDKDTALRVSENDQSDNLKVERLGGHGIGRQRGRPRGSGRGRGRGRGRGGRGAYVRGRVGMGDLGIVTGKRKSPLRGNIPFQSFNSLAENTQMKSASYRKHLGKSDGTSAKLIKLKRGAGGVMKRGRKIYFVGNSRGRSRGTGGLTKKGAQRSLSSLLEEDAIKSDMRGHTEGLGGGSFGVTKEAENRQGLTASNCEINQAEGEISSGELNISGINGTDIRNMMDGDIRNQNMPSTSEKSPARTFSDGMDVLARWTDGLVYLGTIQRVEEDKARCLVSFEDNSLHWVLFKDIQKGQMEVETDDIKCCVCDDGKSDAPNEIVICDKCGTGFHQLCHQPFIESGFLKSEEVQWLCRKCIFANSVKVGGASNKGQAAKIFQEVKRSLPYKLEDLIWDKNHRTNIQKCFCYCGGPGDWYLKMLQCCRCMQWFHEACIQCLSTPMLYGDRFFLFVCSVCNSGPEYIRRLPLKWIDLTHLILYNMTLTFGKKYYVLEDDILPFLNEKWNMLQVDHLASRRSEKHNFILSALQSSHSKFACGKEVKKKKDLWGLRNRSPPVPPAVVLPAVGQITDEVMNNFQSVGGSKVMTFVPAGKSFNVHLPSTSPIPTCVVRRARKSKHLSKEELERETKLARKRLLAATSKKVDRSPSENQNYQGYRGAMPAPPRVQRLGSSILDCIEPLETALERDRLTTIATVHHPRCFVAPTSVHLPLPPPGNTTGTQKLEVPKVKKKRGRKPKHPKPELPKIKKKRGRKPKNYVPENLHYPSQAAGDTGGHSKVNQDQTDVGVNGCSESNMKTLMSSVTSYFGAEGRIASGEKYKVLAKRKTTNGIYQYLIQWEGTTP